MKRDFEINGPAIIRMIETMFKGWKRYKDHPDECIRCRFKREFNKDVVFYTAAVWAARFWYKKDKRMFTKMDKLLKDLIEEFGLKTRLLAPLLGTGFYLAMKKEDRRLKQGFSYEPPTFYEKNDKARELEKNSKT